VVSVLARQLYIGQYDAAKAVHTCHQCRRIAIVGCVGMKDVPSGKSHRLANPRRCLAVSNSQIHYELTPQIGNFGGADVHIAKSQLGADFLNGAMPSKKSLANMDQDIIGYIATTRNQAKQRTGTCGTLTALALPHSLVCDKRACQAKYGLTPCLLHDKPSAAEAFVPFRGEPKKRWLRKQGRQQCLPRQLVEARTQRP